MMKKIVLLGTFIYGIAIPSTAYDFEVDGIYYDSLSSQTCEVVRGDDYLLESIIIPKFVPFAGKNYEVVRISCDAFYAQSSVKNIRIGAGVTAIGTESFMHCNGLTSIDVEEGNPVYSSYGGALYNKQRTCLLKVPIGKTEYDIPNGVIEIGEGAFLECRLLKEVNIPSGIIRIGNNAFAGCDTICIIDIPNSVERIGKYAFSGCKALVSLIIPNSIKEIGRGAFSFCTSLKTFILPHGIKTIPDGLFNGCTTLKTVIIPQGVTYIGDFSFAQCDSLRTVQLPNTIRTLGRDAFSNSTSLKISEIPESLTTICDQAFEYCNNLDTIVLPNKVTEIGNRVFNGCKALTYIDVSEGNPKYKSLLGALFDYKMSRLIKVPALVSFDSIPESITEIDSYAYFKCTDLTKVWIPENVTMIGRWAFVGCDSLHSVYMSKPVDLAETYLPCYNRILYVPIGKKQDFEGSRYYIDQYSRFMSIEEYGVPTVNITKLIYMDKGMDKSAIYNLHGVKIGGGKNSLIKGIYLINGKKVVLK